MRYGYLSLRLVSCWKGIGLKHVALKHMYILSLCHGEPGKTGKVCVNPKGRTTEVLNST